MLTKNPVVEKCSDAGGGCDFVVSITNNGDTDFTDPIAFTDVLSTGDGKPLPNADFGNVSVGNAADINAEFVCKKGGGVLTCATGAGKVKIPPKRTITFPMTITPGPTGGATAVKNCAQLLLDQFAEPVCRTIPLVNGPLLRATKLTAATSCNPECSFSVSIRNVGNADAVFPFTFTDRFTPATKIIAIFTEGGDFTCRLATEQGNGVAVCNGNKQRLAPGEQMIGKIAIMGVPLAPEYTNCIEISPAGGPVDTTFPGRCVTIKEPRPQRPDLAVIKLVQDKLIGQSKIGECKIEGPCNYKIIVMNRGNATYEGPVTFTDEVPEEPRVGVKQSVPGSIDVKADPAWTCTKPNPRSISCTHSKTSLAPGDGASIDLVVTPGANWKKNDVITNCARISTPVGNDAGDNKVNDAECASVSARPVQREGRQDRRPAVRAGQRLHLQAHAVQPGADRSQRAGDDLRQTDGLSSAQIVSITPPLPCATQPTQIPFSCTSPGPVRLDLDAKPGDRLRSARLRDGRQAAERRVGRAVLQLRQRRWRRQRGSRRRGLPQGFDQARGTNGAIDHHVHRRPGDDGARLCVPGADEIEGRRMRRRRRHQHDTAPANRAAAAAAAAAGVATVTGADLVQRRHDPHRGRLRLSAADHQLERPRLRGNRRHQHDAATATEPEPSRLTPPVAASCSGGMILVEGSCACPPAMNWNGRDMRGNRRHQQVDRNRKPSRRRL